MTEIQVGDIAGNFKHLDSTPPDGCKPPVSVMTTEVVVENKPQELRTIRPYTAACLHIPPGLCKEAEVVLRCLFSCFEKAGEVKEGQIGDLMWGFEEFRIPRDLTYKGLEALFEVGFIKFQAKDNSYVSLSSWDAQGAFVRYQPKLLAMVYEG